jgi:hypothetical protein
LKAKFPDFSERGGRREATVPGPAAALPVPKKSDSAGKNLGSSGKNRTNPRESLRIHVESLLAQEKRCTKPHESASGSLRRFMFGACRILEKGNEMQQNLPHESASGSLRRFMFGACRILEKGNEMQQNFRCRIFWVSDRPPFFPFSARFFSTNPVLILFAGI